MALKDKYTTISEAAKEMGVTRQTISRWIKEGKLDGEKIGREILIEKEKLAIIRRGRIAETFDGAMIMAFIHVIREEGKYSKADEIQHMGNLVFDIKKQDGTHDVANITEFSFEPTKIEIEPYEKAMKKKEIRQKMGEV